MISRLVTLEELMERLFPEKWANVSHQLGLLVGLDDAYAPFLRAFEPLGTTQPLSDADMADMKKRFSSERFAGVEQILRKSGLPNTALAVRDMGTFASRPDVTLPQLSRFAGSLARTLKNEMSLHIYFGISPKEADWYDHWRDGWKDVLLRFEDATSDVEEAYKCLALARYPAAIYHATQVADYGSIELGKVIGVTDPLPGLGATDSRLKQILDKKHPPADFERKNHDELEQLNQNVEAMKNAWRNKVSHASGRLIVLPGPASPEIAEDTISAVRGFMRRLQTGLLHEP